MSSNAVVKVLSGPAGYALAIAVAGVVLYLVYNRTKKDLKKAADATLNVNQGTPYEGAGVVGTLGNLTNQALGVAPQSVGEWLGGKVYDWTHSDPAQLVAPSGLPYDGIGGPRADSISLKQNIVDNFYDAGVME